MDRDHQRATAHVNFQQKSRERQREHLQKEGMTNKQIESLLLELGE